MTKETDNAALRSIVKQFRGGEHALAGQRAAQLIYGAAKKPNQSLLDALTADAPGIERYIVAPDSPAPLAEDQGGNPLATQPENDPDQANASNVSTDEAKAEQAAIDKRLEAGRKRAEKAAEKRAAEEASADAGDGDATKLNPDGSGDGTSDKPASGHPGA